MAQTWWTPWGTHPACVGATDAATVARVTDGAENRSVQLTISHRLADELYMWAVSEAAHWPDDTAYHDDLADLIRQLGKID